MVNFSKISQVFEWGQLPGPGPVGPKKCVPQILFPIQKSCSPSIPMNANGINNIDHGD